MIGLKRFHPFKLLWFDAVPWPFVFDINEVSAISRCCDVRMATALSEHCVAILIALAKALVRLPRVRSSLFKLVALHTVPLPLRDMRKTRPLADPHRIVARISETGDELDL